MSAGSVFLDANILFSLAYGSTGLLFLWDLCETGRCELIASQYVIEEAKRNLDHQEKKKTLNSYLSKVRIVPEADPSIPCPIELPEKDIPVFMAAAFAKADYLITGDVTHFGRYYGQTIMGVTICRPREYADFVKSRKR